MADKKSLGLLALAGVEPYVEGKDEGIGTNVAFGYSWTCLKQQQHDTVLEQGVQGFLSVEGEAD